MVFVWRLIQNKISNKDNLMKKGIIFLEVLMIDSWRLLVKVLTIFLTCLVLENAMRALLVKDFIKTDTALKNAVCIQGSFGSTITAEISDGLWRRIHVWFK
ncbi:hypothetical protein MTR_7g066230 [Medicago truncatula]|uniref:Uncharacterized protein n=1 Tax=Medicago truncatula TaxID=3880 RepID=A0A072U1R1_MEDTR|nr:hypothetical protein MTR_7g066230 [Medicago truncatula]